LRREIEFRGVPTVGACAVKLPGLICPAREAADNNQLAASLIFPVGCPFIRSVVRERVKHCSARGSARGLVRGCRVNKNC
jgi:hypothetical protein